MVALAEVDQTSDISVCAQVVATSIALLISPLFNHFFQRKIRCYKIHEFFLDTYSIERRVVRNSDVWMIIEGNGEDLLHLVRPHVFQHPEIQ